MSICSGIKLSSDRSELIDVDFAVSIMRSGDYFPIWDLLESSGFCCNFAKLEMFFYKIDVGGIIFVNR